jgi:hypothetical protein
VATLRSNESSADHAKHVEAWMEKCPLKRSAERLPRLGISTPAKLELGIEAMKMDEGDVERASTPKNSCGSLDFARSIAYLVLPFRQRAAAKRRSLFGLAIHGHALLRRHQVTYRPGAYHDAAGYEPFT